MVDVKTNIIYNEDCNITMDRFPEQSIDLVVTSPPYDNLRNYNGFVFEFEKIANNLSRILKAGGVIVWVVGDQTNDGSESGTSFKQALYFKSLGLNLHDTMIYQKINPIPLTHNRYEQTFEYMFVFSKGKPKTFNPILISCKTEGNYTHRRNTGRVGESVTRNRDEITVTKDKKYKGNVWAYIIGSVKDETGNHPAPFPEQLATDHILSWSNEGDIVYDPFMGSGTTAKMSMINNRRYIGSEISKEYCDIIQQRTDKNDTNFGDDFITW
jgi:DNA modification methylase